MPDREPPRNNVFIDRFSATAESRIEADKVRNTQINATDLLNNNVDFFGVTDVDKASETAFRVLGRYGRSKPYGSFKNILESCDNPTGNKKVAESDRDSMVDAVFIAMNASALGKDLVTDQLSAEDIDNLLVEEVKGVGKFIKERKITKEEESDLLAINKRIEEEGLFDKASDETRGKFYKKWEKKDGEQEGSLVRIYVEACRERMKNIGIKEEMKNVVEESRGKIGNGSEMDEAAKKISEAADKIAGIFGAGKKNKETNDDIDRMAAGEIKNYFTFEDLPKKDEDKFKYIDVVLNVIENHPNDIRRELSLTPFMGPLTRLMVDERVSLDIRDMIKTRLTLKAMGDKLRVNGGSMKEHSGLIECVNELAKDGFDLDYTVMKSFFDNGIEGLDTAWAWNVLEDANFYYEHIINETCELGSQKIQDQIKENFRTKDNFKKMVELKYTAHTPLEGKNRNYFLDRSGNEERAIIVEQYIIEKITRRLTPEGVDLTDEQKKDILYRANKSWQMANFMFRATTEDSCVNWDFIDGDQLSEAYNLGYLRALDGTSGDKGKDTGAEINKYDIPWVMVGVLRKIAGINRNDLPVYAEDIVKKGLTVNYNEEGTRKEKGLSGKSQNLAYVNSILGSKLWPAKLAICSKERPDPSHEKFLKIETLQDANDWFNKVDSDVFSDEIDDNGWIPNKEFVKVSWLMGEIDKALSMDGPKWTAADFDYLHDLATRRKIMGEDGTGKGRSFITEEQWQYLSEVIDLKLYKRKITTRNFVNGLLGGKRRR